MESITVIFGGFFGFTAIVLGAFGSHLLKNKWPKELLDSYEIGVRYQMYHALFLILLRYTLPFGNSYSLLAVSFAIIGTLLFSGSIYGICILKSCKLPVKFLGPLTPIGGLCLLLAWIFYVVAML